MKKTALILLLALMLAPACLHAFAENQRIDAERGEKIAVELVLTANPDKAVAADIILEYDHDVFELVPTAKIGNDRPWLDIIYSGIPEGTTLRPEFRIKQDAAYGEYTISIRVKQAENKDSEEITTMVFSSCIVNVCEKKPDQGQEAEREIKTVQVPVRHVDEEGKPVFPEYLYMCAEGRHIVNAMNVENYQLVDEDHAEILVDADGAHPSEVTFHYKRLKRTAQVTVHFVNEEGQAVLPDIAQILDEGQHSVYAIQMENYLLLDDSHVDVLVDAEGAHPSEVTFHYGRVKKTAQVTVHFFDEAGKAIISDITQIFDEGQHRVYAIEVENYQLLDENYADVMIDTDGAHPAEVTFHYARRSAPTPTPKPTPTPTPKPTDAPTPQPTPDNRIQEWNDLGDKYYDAWDYKQAVKYYGLAADQGDMYAQYRLGFCYEYGFGVDRSYAMAVKYYHSAADQGYMYAQYNLGLYYENGWGVEKDEEEALKYYRLAAEQGYSPAQEKVNQLTATSTLKPTPTRTPTPKPSPTPAPTKNAKTEAFKKVGNYVTFGNYPQTASGKDNTPIEWLVLDYDAKENKALLLSRYGLDVGDAAISSDGVGPFRYWLNHGILKKAFSAKEQSALLTNQDKLDKRDGYSVFLLSKEQAKKYLNATKIDSKNVKARMAPTPYAIKKGAWTGGDKTEDGSAAGWWWLSSTGSSYSYSYLYYYSDGGYCSRTKTAYEIYRVRGSGIIDVCKNTQENKTGTGCIRPAIWVNLNADIFQ